MLFIIYGLLFIENWVCHVSPELALFCEDELCHEKQTTVMNPKFQDITLACNDNRNIQIHKVILVAMSHVHEGFKKRKKHPHPLVDLRGESAPSAPGSQEKSIHGIISCLYIDYLKPTNPSMVKSHLTYLWWINFARNIDYIAHTSTTIIRDN